MDTLDLEFTKHMLSEEENKYYEKFIYEFLDQNVSTVEIATKLIEDDRTTKKFIDANRRIIEAKKAIIMSSCYEGTLIKDTDVNIYNKCSVIDAYISLKVQEKAVEKIINSV